MRLSAAEDELRRVRRMGGGVASSIQVEELDRLGLPPCEVLEGLVALLLGLGVRRALDPVMRVPAALPTGICTTTRGARARV